jgi:hypothetical protein
MVALYLIYSYTSFFFFFFFFTFWKSFVDQVTVSVGSEMQVLGWTRYNVLHPVPIFSMVRKGSALRLPIHYSRSIQPVARGQHLGRDMLFLPAEAVGVRKRLSPLFPGDLEKL